MSYEQIWGSSMPCDHLRRQLLKINGARGRASARLIDDRSSMVPMFQRGV